MNNIQTSLSRVKIGISIGDVNGIGPEVVIKSLLQADSLQTCTPVIYCHKKVLEDYCDILAIQEFKIHVIQAIADAKAGAVNVLEIEGSCPDVSPGLQSIDAGNYAIRSLRAAVRDLKNKQIDALTTAPLSKDLVQAPDFKFPGHTEFLTQEAGDKESLMFLIHENLRIGVATGHIPLQQVSAALTGKKLHVKIHKMLHSLTNDFGLNKPQIAVLGLNPHAGEGGLLGKEEEEVIAPVIESIAALGHHVTGPHPSDGFFGMHLHEKVDGVLAMYHDQGLIPFKTLAFDKGVNYTAGPSFIRTSPDHGTAFGIAGKNLANADSFKNALQLAVQIAQQRTKKARLETSIT
ncbi:MAG: 4-hydroxythreonine-4-phosphate dehydrogenase PdxA [Bacteroidota bacterium]